MGYRAQYVYENLEEVHVQKYSVPRGIISLCFIYFMFLFHRFFNWFHRKEINLKDVKCGTAHHLFYEGILIIKRSLLFCVLFPDFILFIRIWLQNEKELRRGLYRSLVCRRISGKLKLNH